MNTPSITEIKADARDRLSQARDRKQIILIYAGVTLGLSALVVVINYILSLQFDQLGGLRHLGTRKILSTLQTVLPLVQSLINVYMNIGLVAAMLRIARGQYASPRTLKLGFDRFWVVLRCTLFKSLLLSTSIFLGVYWGILIFLISPLSENTLEVLTPYLTQASILSPEILMNDADYLQFSQTMLPAYLICTVPAALLAIPMLYSFRLSSYILIDRPAMGALAVLRESKRIMRGRRLQLLKLDLSLWWYYGALLLTSALGYGDLILSLLNIPLPLSPEVCSFLFYALYLIAVFALYVLTLDRVEAIYALYYDRVKPQEKPDSGVVLDNIFQM